MTGLQKVNLYPSEKYTKMKQNNEIRFKCTTDEKQKIKEKASKIGMSIKAYLLYLGLNSTLKVSFGE